MDEVLFKLTPPEFYVWAFLCARALYHDQDLVTIPQKPLGPPGWKFYTRQHLKRILKSLEAKKFLVITHSPANQHQDLVVAITRRHRLNVDVRPGRQECSGSLQGEQDFPSVRTPVFRQVNKDGPFVPEASGPGRTPEPGQAHSASASAKEKSLKASSGGVEVTFETLLRLDQGTLLKGIMTLDVEDLLLLEQQLARLAPVARGRRLSRKAKVYAAMRFLQSDRSFKNPAAWVESVAKRADYEMERMGWKDDRSGNGGRSQSRERYAGS